MTASSDDDGHSYVLIEYEWLPEVVGDLRESLRKFARRARVYDEEAGFTAIPDLEGPPPDRVDGPARRLVVRAAKGEEDLVEAGEVVGYGTIIDVDPDGVGRMVFVVSPEHRSRGIATLLIERLSAAATAEDWFGTGLSGLRVLADGAHPAAGRLAARFGFKLVGETWLLLRMVLPPRAATAPASGPAVKVVESRSAAVLRAGVPVPAPAGFPGDGRTLVERRYNLGDPGLEEAIVVVHGADADGRPDPLARLRFTAGVGGRADADIDLLIDTAIGHLHEQGARAVLAEVDPRENALVRACRRNHFQHDQSNLIYEVPLRRS